MITQKPSTPKGTRDFLPIEIAKRNYIFGILKEVFQTFGFQPIETPSFENYSTLFGKYGDEGDSLIFKILNSGNYLSKVDLNLLAKKDSKKITPQISEKALRYDLTVPFARYIAQHQNELELPFKRFQIQPVWRADRPQKARFREFFQCDADVVGSKSIWQEIEFIQLYDTVFSKLGLAGTTIKINHRKILYGISEIIGAKDKLIDLTVAIDKLDKVGIDQVIKEMTEKGISKEAIKKIEPFFYFHGSNSENIKLLERMLSTSKKGLEGIEDLRFLIEKIEALGLETSDLKFDITLARGLNYYTGVIFEVAAPKIMKIGAIGGGGRYDNLTGIFGLKGISGIGISFGLERIYLALEELNLLKKIEKPKPDVLFINFGNDEAFYCIKAIKKLRIKGVKAELYPDSTKMKKQMKYANKRKIHFVVLVGLKEMKENIYTIKNMKNGEQQECDFNILFKLIVNS